jgi:hypothetical protein
MISSVGLLSVLWLGSYIRPASAQQNNATASEGKESSIERMLTITFDQSQIDAETLHRLFTNAGIVQRAARTVWPGKKIVNSPDLYSKANSSAQLLVITEFEVTLGLAGSATAGITSGTLTVAARPAQDEKKLQQFVDAIDDQILSLLRTRSEALQKQSLRELEQRQKLLAMLNDDLMKRREQKQQMVQTLGGNLRPREVLLDSIQQLQREIQSLELDVVSMNVRIKSLEKEIAVQHVEVDKGAKSSAAVESLASLIKASEEQLQLMEEANKKAGSAAIPKLQFLQVQQQLMKQKVDLAQAKSEAQKPGADRIEQLVSQLTQNSIDLSVAEARLKHAKEQLDENLSSLQKQEGVALHAQELDGEIDRLSKTLERHNQWPQFQAAPIEPSISVEAEPDPEAATKPKSE